MVLRLRDMFRGIFRYWDDHISGDGAWWILALNGVFLIPLMFAAFFFPVGVLIGVGAALALVAGIVALRRALHVHPHRAP